MSDRSALWILGVALLLTAVMASGALMLRALDREAASERFGACVAALDDHADIYALVGEAFGNEKQVARSKEQVHADLAAHEARCRSER